jgi:hypothetical protein
MTGIVGESQRPGRAVSDFLDRYTPISEVLNVLA